MSAEKHVKTKNPLFGWTATDRPLEIPPDNLEPASSTGTSINIFVRGVGVGLTHTKNLMMKTLIDGDVDKYFCPGSGGRTYPHQKFDDEESPAGWN